MLVVSFIFFIILFVLALFVFFVGFARSDDGTAGCFILGVFFLSIPAISFMCHCDDLATVRHGNLLIEVRRDAIKQIDEQLKDIKITQTSLMNNDSPAKSLIETKTKFVEELAKQQIEIANAKISIEKRSLGLMSATVKIFGKE